MVRRFVEDMEYVHKHFKRAPAVFNEIDYLLTQARWGSYEPCKQ